MKARPILMHARSIQNLLAGRKTQTRRIVKPQPRLQLFRRHGCWSEGGISASAEVWSCPYGQPGDLLWVRETWDFRPWGSPDTPNRVRLAYAAGGEQRELAAPDDWNPMLYGTERWRPSIHMPRWASRLTLRITDVRIERLNEISDGDCVAEGVDLGNFKLPGDTALVCYRRIWEDINGQFSWGDNPWVWALTFEVVHANVDNVLSPAKA